MSQKKRGFFHPGLPFFSQVLLGILIALGISFSHAEAQSPATQPHFWESETPLISLSIPSTANQNLTLAQPDRPTPNPEFSLIKQGIELYQAGRFAAAIPIWQQALHHYQQQGDRLKQAMVLNHLALTYKQLGQWLPANEAIATSLTLLKNATLNTPTATLIFAQALNTQGSLQFAQGQLEVALESWKQATKQYAQANQESGRIATLINQAQAQQALGFYRRAQATLLQVNQSLQKQPASALKAAGLLTLGNTLHLMGSIDQPETSAIPSSPDQLSEEQALTQSLAIANQLRSPELIAEIQLSLGNAAQTKNQPDIALQHYQQANSVSQIPLTQLQAKLNQLTLFIQQQQPSAIQTLWPQIQSQLASLPPTRKTIYASLNFAQNLMKIQNRDIVPPKTIAQILAIAIQQAQKLQDPRAESYALGYLGQLYEHTQQWSDAKELTQEALFLAQTINVPEIAYQWQWQLGRIFRAQGRFEQAQDLYQTVFNTLKSLRSDLAATNPDTQYTFRDRVEPVYREYTSLLLRSTGQGIEPSQVTLKQARDVIESLQLAELNNFFRSACLEGQLVPIEQIDQKDTAVFYPIILADRLAIILSLPNSPLRYYTHSIPQPQVEETLETLRQDLEKPFTTPTSKALSKQVYDWLIQPIQADLARSQIQTLVFVLDGSLRNIPMAALYDGQQYLIERYSVALTPGLSLLAPKPLKQEKLTALLGGLTDARQGFVALPNVGLELKAIQAEIPSRVLLNQEFTKSALRQQIEALPVSVIHLATHGQFSSEKNKTFILTWDTPLKIEALQELLSTRDSTRSGAIALLVLSACETAAGDKRATLGLAGIAVQAGARSTVASLWSLDDESGALLISEFYRQLAKQTLTKAEALRQAQLTLLKNPDYRSPAHWAPYVLVGNWL